MQRCHPQSNDKRFDWNLKQTYKVAPQPPVFSARSTAPWKAFDFIGLENYSRW